MVDRIVCESGCVYPAYELRAPNGTVVIAKPRLASSYREPKYLPTQEEMQRILEKNWDRMNDPKFKVDIASLF